MQSQTNWPTHVSHDPKPIHDGSNQHQTKLDQNPNQSLTKLDHNQTTTKLNRTNYKILNQKARIL